MLRIEFVRRKLQLIADDLGMLVAFRDDSYEQLTKDAIRLAAAERIVERIVMRAIDINEHLMSEFAGADERTTRLSYKDTFLFLAKMDVCSQEFAERISRSAGLRNILVHDYNDIDRKIFYASIQDCLKDYHSYLDFVLKFIEEGPDE